VDINLSNILLSKIVYIIRKILNIEYNLLGILKLENVLLTAIYNGEFSNISRKSIVYNVIHKLINKEEVLNKYSYSSCKEYNLEVCLNNSLKSRILDKSNCVNSRGLICGTIGIREYSNITTSSKLDYSLFCLDRLSYLKEFYGMNCCNKELLLTIINNYTSNNLCRLPFHKPRLYPIRNNQ